MLRSFRVANHKSFRDEAELLLVPAYDRSRPAVPVAGIFGANAAGKSNLLDALRWMQIAVRESYAAWEPGSGVPRTPFRLDPAGLASPSLYCVELTLDGERYTYGVEVDDERVLDEWLYTYPHNRRRSLFERKDAEIRLGSTVPDFRQRGAQLARQTRANALFLSVAAHNALAEVQPVYHWFRSLLTFADGKDVEEEQLVRWLSDELRRVEVLTLIREADLGITDVTIADDSARRAIEAELTVAATEIERLTNEQRRISEKIASAAESDPNLAAARINATRRENEKNQARVRALMAQANGLIAQFRDLAREGRLRFHHGKNNAALSLSEQSAGTRSLISLVSATLGAISSGATMVVDELDASLHPYLAAQLLRMFRDPETNQAAAQLLFTTHDATLLDEDNLARDEIWFVEKNPDSGATRLYPLTDFHPRKHEDVEGRYLAGSYGAVPVLSNYRLRRALAHGRVRDAAA